MYDQKRVQEIVVLSPPILSVYESTAIQDPSLHSIVLPDLDSLAGMLTPDHFD